MRMELVFLILNYNTENETKDLIESIKANMDSDLFHIVIVDNASKDNSGYRLRNKYADDDVTVLINEKNLGFANGNNVGLKYIYKHLDTNFICVLNSDVLLREKSLCNKLHSEYEASGCFVIGPKIILKNGTVQKCLGKLRDIKYYETEKQSHEQICGINKKLDGVFLRRKIIDILNCLKIKDLATSFYHRMIGYNDKFPNDQRHEDLILHGCCLFFSPIAIKNEYLFNPNTFLYREEELLYVYLKKKGFKSVYSPNIEIVHLEDAATGKIVNKQREKQLFYSRNQINSLTILIEEIKHMEDSST